MQIGAPHATFGFQVIELTDQVGSRGILKQSSVIDCSNPSDRANSSFVLLGREDAPLKLNMEQVAELVDHLQVWLEEGQFAAPVAAALRKTA